MRLLLLTRTHIKQHPPGEKSQTHKSYHVHYIQYYIQDKVVPGHTLIHIIIGCSHTLGVDEGVLRSIVVVIAICDVLMGALPVVLHSIAHQCIAHINFRSCFTCV